MSGPANGFCQVKTIPKIRTKLGSGLVGQAPTRTSFLGGNIVYFCRFFFRCTCLKKMDRRVGIWCLDNPSFSRIFGIILT